MSKTTIFVMRHGQSIGNANHEAGVMTDREEYSDAGTPLTELGIKQAQKVAEKLKDVHFYAIFSSDLIRAKQTAEIIAKDRGPHVNTETTIRERYFGKDDHTLTKKKRTEIEHALAELNDEEKLNYRYLPDGETGMEAVGRFRAFLNEIIPLYKGKTILVVNHGNVMRSFLIHQKFATYDELPSGSIQNTGYFVMQTDGEVFTVGETDGIAKK